MIRLRWILDPGLVTESPVPNLFCCELPSKSYLHLKRKLTRKRRKSNRIVSGYVIRNGGKGVGGEFQSAAPRKEACARSWKHEILLPTYER
jgi:hypothetical protein